MPETSTILATEQLRAVFTRQRDRVSHTIELFDTATQSWLTILESLEGAPDDAWPASPPLQQLHIEKRGATAVALMVGMAGVGHWSASIETLEGNRIRFDMACRTSVTPSKLQSAYKIIQPKAINNILIEPHHGTTQHSAESGLSFSPVHLSDPVPATFRWGYDLAVITF